MDDDSTKSVGKVISIDEGQVFKLEGKLEGKLEVGPLSLNFDRQDFDRQELHFNQAGLDLTPIELKVLFHLVVHVNEPRSATQLAQSISSTRGKKVQATRIRGVIHLLRQ